MRKTRAAAMRADAGERVADRAAARGEQGAERAGKVSLVMMDGAPRIRHEVFDQVRPLQADGNGHLWI